MNRRTLVQSILALPIFGWLNRPHAALATHAARTEGAIQGLKAHYGTQPQGLRARRQELVDTFLKTLDSAIQAEEQYGFPYDAGPESLYFNLEIRYPNNGRLTSSHKMKWSEPQKPAREPDELKDVAFEDFVLTETGRPVARGTRLRWNYRTGMLTVGEDEPIYAPHYRDNLRVHEKPPARPDLFWPEREWVSVGDGVQQVQFKKERV